MSALSQVHASQGVLGQLFTKHGTNGIKELRKLKKKKQKTIQTTNQQRKQPSYYLPLPPANVFSLKRESLLESQAGALRKVAACAVAQNNR